MHCHLRRTDTEKLIITGIEFLIFRKISVSFDVNETE